MSNKFTKNQAMKHLNRIIERNFEKAATSNENREMQLVYLDLGTLAKCIRNFMKGEMKNEND